MSDSNKGNVNFTLKYDKDIKFTLRADKLQTKLSNLETSLIQDLSYEENTWPYNQMNALRNDVKNMIEEVEIKNEEDEKAKSSVEISEEKNSLI